jgi:NitT/TauT family transport system substrate-binding protein
LAACQPDASPDSYELTTVTINNSTHMSYAPIYIAEAEGYFEEFGIQLEKVTFNQTVEGIPLLLSGQLDVYAGANNPGLINIFREEPSVKAVAQRGAVLSGSCTYLGVLVRKDLYDSGAVSSLEDLKGLKVVVTETGTTGYAFSQMIGQVGLTFADVETHTMPPSGYVDAFRNQTVDAIVTPELNLTRLLLDGNAVLFGKAEDVVSPFLTSVLAFGKRLIVDDPDIGVRFMAAYLKGVEKYNEGATEENLEIINQVSGDDIEILKTACWIPIPLNPEIDFEGVEGFQKWLYDEGHIDALITEEQFWDPSFIEEAHKLFGD